MLRHNFSKMIKYSKLINYKPSFIKSFTTKNGNGNTNGNNQFTLTQKNTKIDIYLPTKQDSPSILCSKIRSLDIGKNYFSKINPKRRKYLITLLNSYTKSFPEEECLDLEDALDIYFNNHYNGRHIDELKDNKLDLSIHIVNHLYFLMVLDRLSSSYARYDFTDYHLIIQTLNNRPKDQRNKAKYVFTSHPTQPNSIKNILKFYYLFHFKTSNLIF